MDDEDEKAPPKWIGKLAFGLFVLFIGLSVALAHVRWESERPATGNLISDRPALLVVESASCGWCRHFRTKLGPDYERSRLETLAPLKYVDISAARPGAGPYRLSSRIVATPTFVLVDRTGREIDRLRGIPGGRDEFMREIERMVGRMEKSAIN